MKHAKKIGVEAWNHDGERHNLLYREELEHPECEGSILEQCIPNHSTVVGLKQTKTEGTQFNLNFR